ncbi:uncharacterized protein LOC124165580 [Ischnura elegans]|uniref:uncharacterized protein LOC124165580 n=1 Tax=Ischnura elegans TaxID=197161 RepID=UPI001ED8B33A|nr:uncharacterized protein LOC124165580 [Ischnura elegans]XP_046398994.1 uncharacterized protein LOC124165580 [Ischnura elegans]
MAGSISAVMVLLPILAYGSMTTPRIHDGPLQERIHRPWEDRHEPPPLPGLPPMPPGATASSGKFRARNPDTFPICSERECSCESRTKDGEELVDITCRCLKPYTELNVWVDNLPPQADTLDISDCYIVRLQGVDHWGQASSEDGRGHGSLGQRSTRKKSKKNLRITRRRKRREVVAEEEGEDGGGGVLWDEAVWEAEMGSPDDEEGQEETDPPEEEEPDTMTEGEEAEKGGRYARAVPDSNAFRPLSSLVVRRAWELSMRSHAVGAVRSVLLEDVLMIDEFPARVFEPPPPSFASATVGYPEDGPLPHGEVWEMDSVTLKNISNVKKFSAYSFGNVLLKSHFLWDRTNVVIVDKNAIWVTFNALDEDESVDPCETSYRAKTAEEASSTTATTTEQGEENGSRAEEGGLKTACEAPQGVFTVTNSMISMWSMNAFGIAGARLVSFSGCIATTLRPSAIFVGSANFFSFTRNNVLESVSANAFDVTASFAEFRRNKFGRLQEEAMSGVKPMPSKILYGLPHLTFEDNLLIDVDLWSLHPNWDISKFASNKSKAVKSAGYSFHKNSFADCSCPHLGWIVQMAIGQEATSGFYAHLMQDESGNYCVREAVEPMGLVMPCRLPLRGIASLFEEDGMTCRRHVDVVALCEMYGNAASRLISSYLSQVLIALVPCVVCTIVMSSLFRVII